MAEVNNRPVFKMNNDFWNQARGPPQNMPQNLSNSNQNSPVPGSTNSIPAHSPSQQSNSSQIHVVTPGALALQQANQQNNQQQGQNSQQAHVQQQQQNATQQQNQQQQSQQQQQTQQQQMAQQQMNQQQAQNNGQNQPQQPPQQSPHMGSPNPHAQAAHAHALAQVAQQQQMVNMHQQLSSGQNSPDKLMTEKIVNELQPGVALEDQTQKPSQKTESANTEETEVPPPDSMEVGDEELVTDAPKNNRAEMRKKVDKPPPKTIRAKEK
nr:transcription factor SPT20 homolog [Leptinotarsa decemlineata]